MKKKVAKNGKDIEIERLTKLIDTLTRKLMDIKVGINGNCEACPYKREIAALQEVTESLHKEIERLDRELDDAISTAREYLKESRDKNAEIVDLKAALAKQYESPTQQQMRVKTEALEEARKEIAALKAELNEWQKQVCGQAEVTSLLLENLFNPCGHTGAESRPCEICGYPDPRKAIAALKAELVELKKHEAVCHCGINYSSHSGWDGHSFVEMQEECPFQKDLAALKAEAIEQRSRLDRYEFEAKCYAEKLAECRGMRDRRRRMT